jgi:hypothetical protein
VNSTNFDHGQNKNGKAGEAYKVNKTNPLTTSGQAGGPESVEGMIPGEGVVVAKQGQNKGQGKSSDKKAKQTATSEIHLVKDPKLNKGNRKKKNQATSLVPNEEKRAYLQPQAQLGDMVARKG